MNEEGGEGDQHDGDEREHHEDAHIESLGERRVALAEAHGTRQRRAGRREKREGESGLFSFQISDLRFLHRFVTSAFVLRWKAVPYATRPAPASAHAPAAARYAA